MNSEELSECLTALSETCKKLSDLIDRKNSQLFCLNSTDQGTTNKKYVSQLSNSSSTSSALSSSSTGGGGVAATAALSDGSSSANSEAYLRNQVSSNIITYCYDIAFTVKKIVCLIGADS